jgi:SAM-dependent methyltransferase
LDARAANRRFYDTLWSAGYLVPPDRFNTWPLLSELASAVARLRSRGGRATLADVTALPFADQSFDLVCAFDIVEHVEDDRRVVRELSRVAKQGATVLLSVPLHPARWSAFDTLVGHVRRYDAEALVGLLAAYGLQLERSACFGMEPRSRWLLDFAVWGLTKRRLQAMRWYNAVFLPLGLFLQGRLAWMPGLIDVAAVGELALVCRRDAQPARPGSLGSDRPLR